MKKININIEKLLDKTVLIILIVQLVFIFCMNLFRADTIIDFDSSSAYLHEIEMGSQGKVFPSEYSYQASMDLDSASLLSAFIYHFTKNIFLARGIANNLVVLFYIYVITCILKNIDISVRWKRFCLLLFFIPYSMIMLGYWRMLFTGGGFYAFRALVPLLIISLLLDLDKGKAFKKILIRLIILLFIVFLTGLSSGAYVLMSAVFPLLLWEFANAFFKGDYKQIRSKKMLLALSTIFAALVGMVLQKAIGFSSTADTKFILTSNKWIDALLSSFAGIFELFGGLTVHENVKLFSFEAIGAAIDFIVTCILLFTILYTLSKCIKKKELSNMQGYIFSLLLVNAFMFSFLDLKYGSTVFESRYHLIPILPVFILLAIMLDQLSLNEKLNRLQINTIHIIVIGIFFASTLYGDAQWFYARTALGCDKLVELNQIMEKERVQTAVVVGEDSKDLGRKLRVYSREVNYLVVNDAAESAFRTTFGGTTRYLDNAMQLGKTAIIASPEAYKTLPLYLVSDMKYFRDYDGLKIYLADNSRFDYATGPVAEKDKVIDFPYTTGYIYENAVLDADGAILMSEGGGNLKASYKSVEGIWNYKIYYDAFELNTNVYVVIQVGENKFVNSKMNPSANYIEVENVAMEKEQFVDFMLSAPQGTKIKQIEISRKK